MPRVRVPHTLPRMERRLVPMLLAVAGLCAAPGVGAQVILQNENVRTEYGQVLRAEPIYQNQRETWIERQCQDGEKQLLSRIAGAVKDAFKPGPSENGKCRDVPVVRDFRRVVGYDVDYMFKGSKYRSRLPYDPGNRIKLRVSVAPYATSGDQ
jgi:uncharacterized protein YcfJ